MVNVNYNVNWINWNTFEGGNEGGNVAMFKQNWFNDIIIRPGEGFLSVALTGTVTLADGTVCRINYPTDSSRVPW